MRGGKAVAASEKYLFYAHTCVRAGPARGRRGRGEAGRPDLPVRRLSLHDRRQGRAVPGRQDAPQEHGRLPRGPRQSRPDRPRAGGRREAPLPRGYAPGSHPRLRRGDDGPRARLRGRAARAAGTGSIGQRLGDQERGQGDRLVLGGRQGPRGDDPAALVHDRHEPELRAGRPVGRDRQRAEAAVAVLRHLRATRDAGRHLRRGGGDVRGAAPGAGRADAIRRPDRRRISTRRGISTCRATSPEGGPSSAPSRPTRR